MDCHICGQAAEAADIDFCPIHSLALQSVRHAYEVWSKAFRGIERHEFLKRVVKLQGTGRNAKEIVEFLMQHPEKWE